MPRGDRILLRHMLDAALKARHFIQGRSRGELDSDEMLALKYPGNKLPEPEIV